VQHAVSGPLALYKRRSAASPILHSNSSQPHSPVEHQFPLSPLVHSYLSKLQPTHHHAFHILPDRSRARGQLGPRRHEYNHQQVRLRCLAHDRRQGGSRASPPARPRCIRHRVTVRTFTPSPLYVRHTDLPRTPVPASISSLPTINTACTRASPYSTSRTRTMRASRFTTALAPTTASTSPARRSRSRAKTRMLRASSGTASLGRSRLRPGSMASST
jgi:hypothetical protein